MTRFLTTSLRRALEKAVRAAREVADEGAADAVRRLAVAEAMAPAAFDEPARALRRRLRAHARTLGDMVAADGTHGVQHLVEATGYAQWHRRLFARFLAERGLLRHPDHGSVSLEDCEELAPREGFADASAAAESYGARMLPGVFNPDDPVLSLDFAPEHARALARLVEGLDPATFQADDSLGWTYQFWRAAEKDRVNRAGGKIGATELPAVTQLFTEPYMVRFLLHNTLGAWRAGKILAARPELAAEALDEDALRAAVALPGYDFDMLRFVREGDAAPRWRPAAGAYPGWPGGAASLTVLDPCCGSGHFLTEALTVLAGLRAEEEGLAPREAVTAVLKDNLFGLEIDGRCVQIAAFGVALTAWKIGGWQTLPIPHIAWVGAPPPLPKPEFVALANGDAELREGLDKLWDVFAQAPLLGSLIEPTGGDLISPQRLGRIGPLLDRLVEKTRDAEPARAEGAVAARGMSDAATLLARRYVLAATNVPFLGRGKQVYELQRHVSLHDEVAKGDLATAMLSRITRMISVGGTVAAVSPQYWLFQGSYELFRRQLLTSMTFTSVAGLGPRAFVTISGEVVNVALGTIVKGAPAHTHEFATINALSGRNGLEKESILEGGAISQLSQQKVLSGPDARIVLESLGDAAPLSRYASSFQGIKTGDDSAFRRKVWEIFGDHSGWRNIQGTVEKSIPYGGLSDLVYWGRDGRHIARLQGLAAHGRVGCAVTQMSNLPASLYLGGAFDSNVSAIALSDERLLAPIWCYLSSTDYLIDLKKLEPGLKANNAVMVKVPFDLAHWRRVADERYPHGLPEPYSNDPTQWLFHGHPAAAETGTGLHVALARLAGYCWPAERNPDMRLSAEARAWIAKADALPAADGDGLLSLEAVAGELPLPQRLRAFLGAAFGTDWSDSLERRLVAEADQVLDKRAARDPSLEAWLRDRAFRQHCRLFHDRPFLWQVWDGQPDGFSVFVHYHRLDAAALRKLNYTILGDWIARMDGIGDSRRAEAAKILKQRLTAILEGEAPLDIFVRWKSLEKQSVGWAPDLDDGVRLNIRPFIEAGVLREIPRVTWGVDRGNDIASAPWFHLDHGKRNNDRHLTLAQKREARTRTRSAG